MPTGRWGAGLRCQQMRCCSMAPFLPVTLRAPREAGLEDAKVYETKEELARALKARVQPGDIVWFKGSRSMQMEDVLQEVFPEADNTEEDHNR